jgi:hypothetical protein
VNPSDPTPIPATTPAVPPRYAVRPDGGPNVSRHAVTLGPTAFVDMAIAFGGQRPAASAYNRFLAQRARRAAGRLTDWPDGEDDYAA